MFKPLEPPSALEFKVTLEGIEPPIWRAIRIPSEASMWDLHVAIQDAMGWLDCHLHSFRVRTAADPRGIDIGIVTGEEFSPVTPGWEVPVALVFREEGATLHYVYDFGDDWDHTVTLVKVITSGRAIKKPQCGAGERACPPEDCGGLPGYMELVAALRDPSHPEHASMKEWAPDDFDPERFDPKGVEFSDPEKRFRIMMED